MAGLVVGHLIVICIVAGALFGQISKRVIKAEMPVWKKKRQWVMAGLFLVILSALLPAFAFPYSSLVGDGASLGDIQAISFSVNLVGIFLITRAKVAAA